jgi:hypothetical protein
MRIACQHRQVADIRGAGRLHGGTLRQLMPLGEADYYLTTCLNLSSNISRPFRYAS